MKKISIFDTSISNHNLGNQIITESINEVLNSIFPFDFFFKLPCMEITKHTYSYLNNSDYVFFGGTNALSNKMKSYSKQWNLNILNYKHLAGTILLGVGWWQYQEQKIGFLRKFILQKTLSNKYCHSVRDQYTKDKLASINITNTINTGCPTIWKLTPNFCKEIRTSKSSNAIITLTDFNQNRERDEYLIKIVSENYEKVFFWPQSSGDLEYLQSIKIKEVEKIIKIPPNLKAFDDLLESQDINYIGTKLHGGIRALQRKQKTIIIGIDNRAIEMHRDFNLPVLEPKDILNLNELINKNIETSIKIPIDKIEQWKKQFTQ